MQNAEVVECSLAGKIASVDMNIGDRNAEPDESICVSEKNKSIY
jgi:hypothetical protein